MKSSRHFLVAAGLAFASPALAQPTVVATEPVDGATVAKVSMVSVTFSEPMIAAMSGVDVVMTGMPGMGNHAAMKINGVRVSLSPDGKTLVANIARILPVGSYEVDWHGVSTQTQRVGGKLTFTVKAP
jgi:methionine-rich copper-binding protein CopC